jgi:hypothetical protein
MRVPESVEYVPIDFINEFIEMEYRFLIFNKDWGKVCQEVLYIL